MTIVEFANKVFSFGVILSQLFIVASLVYVVFFRKKFNQVGIFLSKYGLFFAFLVSLISTLGSLFYSQIAGFAPCDLCWVQRVGMYPQVLILLYALVTKKRMAATLGLWFSAIGAFVSLYHNSLYYYNGGLSVFCQLGGMQVSCVKRYVFEFGYVTIPMMAFTAFLLIIIFLIFSRISVDSNQQ